MTTIVVVVVAMVKGHEMKGEGDKWVHGESHDEVEVEGNEVESETKLNKSN